LLCAAFKTHWKKKPPLDEEPDKLLEKISDCLSGTAGDLAELDDVTKLLSKLVDYFVHA